MQPKRDKNDIRFWPQKDGGTGFHRGPGKPRYQFSALRQRDQHRNLVTDYAETLPSIVDVADDYSPDTVQSRARAAVVLAIAKLRNALADDAQVQTVAELAQSINALGRIGGVQSVDMKHAVTHTLLSGEERARRAHELTQRATARILANPLPDTALHDDTA